MSSSKTAKTGQAVSEAVKRQAARSKQQHLVPAQPSREPYDRETIGDNEPLRPEQLAEQYPTSGNTVTDKRDAKYELLEELRSDPNTADTLYGRLQWSDDVLDYVMKKKQAGEKAKFEDWFARHFDKMSPTAKALARDLYPRFYRERQKTLKMNVKLLERLASLRLNGVRSKSDLYLQYAAENGLIDMTTVLDILHPEASRVNEVDRFQRGLFNPRRRFEVARPPQAFSVNRAVYENNAKDIGTFTGMFSALGDRNGNDDRGVTPFAVNAWARND